MTLGGGWGATRSSSSVEYAVKGAEAPNVR
jgi:hypothetical protein